VVLSGSPVSSTTKTGGDNIVEILMKMALNTKNQKSIFFEILKIENVILS
jgi:hypothetical protein